MTVDSDQAAERFALLPDWREGVRLTQAFTSTVNTSRSGLEQRQRRRQRPVYHLEYQRTALTPAEAQGRLDAIKDEFRKPLTVPFWTDGIVLQSSMTVATAALLDSNPILAEWNAPFDVFLWDPSLGGEWRTLTVINGRNLTFSGSGQLFPAGAFVFPSRRMIREAGDVMGALVDVQSGREIVRLRTL